MFIIFKKSRLSIVIIIYCILFCAKVSASNTRFAIIGDFGKLSDESRSVSVLVKSWHPDFIITTGDNNYPLGAEETIDDNIGSLYSTFIYPYYGKYSPSPIKKNRFFPCLGNHDMDTDKGYPYLKYFSLPGNKRYYDFIKGDIHFFVLSSDPREPDGVDITSKQAEWVKKRIKASISRWKIVYFHHPAYSSPVKIAYTGNLSPQNAGRKIDFPFSDWGVDIVLNGHVHVYERFQIQGIPYIINGLGGGEPYEFTKFNSESLVKFTGECGAMLAEVEKNRVLFKFITTTGIIIDEFSITK